MLAFLVSGGVETWYATGYDHMEFFIQAVGNGVFSGCAGIPGCQIQFVVKGWAVAAVSDASFTQPLIPNPSGILLPWRPPLRRRHGSCLHFSRKVSSPLEFGSQLTASFRFACFQTNDISEILTKLPDYHLQIHLSLLHPHIIRFALALERMVSVLTIFASTTSFSFNERFLQH